MDDSADPNQPPHPLQRAHRFFQQAAPVIREVGDAIVQHVDEVVANATAIEGTVVEEADDARAQTEARPAPESPHERPRAVRVRPVHVAIIAAGATYGALRLQRRRRAA